MADGFVVGAITLIAASIIAALLLWLRKRLLYRHQAEEALSRVFFTVTVPKEEAQTKEGETPKTFRDAVGRIEPLFAALTTTIKKPFWDFRWRLFGQETYTFEITASDGEIFFTVGSPAKRRELIEKQIHAHYPDAQIEVARPRMFSPDRKVAATSLELGGHGLFPIKNYKGMEDDPLNALANALSKIGTEASASVQILVRPTTFSIKKSIESMGKRIAGGKGGGSLLSDVAAAATGKSTEKPSEQISQRTPVQEEQLKLLSEKASETILQGQVRLVTTGEDDAIARLHLESLISAFGQYSTPNVFFKPAKERWFRNEGRIVADYLTSHFGRAPILILNTTELASLFHLPNQWTAAPNIRWLSARRFAPPVNLPESGVIIGETIYRGERKTVRLKEDDRRRHLFMIGKTGTGKSTLFETMALQDISEGKGVCIIDPLGDLAESILSKIPRNRAEDVIYFDPSDTERPMGVNLLSYKKPEERDFLVANWIEIFYKLFDPGKTGIIGPQWEHWGRNAALTVMAQPGGGTLVDIPRLFTDDAYRSAAIANVKDPVVKSFWQQQLQKTADFHKSEMYNYFISKFGRFMTNDLMRNIIGQTESSFDFRELMDSGKILLVNLAKGKIGETNSNLLGLILVSRLQTAAFSRTDIPEEGRRDFYVYIDEFQNFTTDTFATILSEARKYRLDLNITNQYVAQLTEQIRDAVIGNVGTIISFRIGAQDAELLAKEFKGVTASDFMNLDKFHTYVKLLVDGTPTPPFTMRTIKTDIKADEKAAEAIKKLSALKYGKTKEEVERRFQERLNTGKLQETPAVFEALKRESG
jgi:hypothetical protein